MLFIIIKQWGYSLIYALPIIISLIISLSIYWRKNISNIKLVEKLCYRSFISDCNVVENSPYSSWKGLSMNNLALSFFVSQFICIIISFTLGIYNVLNTIYLISAIVFIPISFYSIYSQIQIKKICPLCLIILICVFTETLMSIYMLKSPASIGVLIMWGFINICVLCLLHFHSHNNLNQQDLLNTKVQLLKLKRNRDIILLKSSQVDFMRTTMWFGKEDSSINITTIISPSCKHCR